MRSDTLAVRIEGVVVEEKEAAVVLVAEELGRQGAELVGLLYDVVGVQPEDDVVLGVVLHELACTGEVGEEAAVELLCFGAFFELVGEPLLDEVEHFPTGEVRPADGAGSGFAELRHGPAAVGRAGVEVDYLVAEVR